MTDAVKLKMVFKNTCFVHTISIINQDELEASLVREIALDDEKFAKWRAIIMLQKTVYVYGSPGRLVFSRTRLF